jgi:hypothetical protein
MFLGGPTFSSALLGFHFLAVATSVPTAGGNEIPCNFKGLFRNAELGGIIRFDDYVEMGMELSNK